MSAEFPSFSSSSRRLTCDSFVDTNKGCQGIAHQKEAQLLSLQQLQKRYHFDNVKSFTFSSARQDLVSSLCEALFLRLLLLTLMSDWSEILMSSTEDWPYDRRCCALCAHGWGHVTFVRSALVVERRECRRSSLRRYEVFWTWSWSVSTSCTSLRSRSSRPVSLEESSWRLLSFCEHLTSIAPSARALRVLLCPGSLSSGGWRFCRCSWSSLFSWACQVAQSLNKALCVLSSCRPWPHRRHLNRADPILQVLRTTWRSELPWSIPIRYLHRLKGCIAWVFRDFLAVVSESWLNRDHRWSLAFNKLSFVASCALLRGKKRLYSVQTSIQENILDSFGSSHSWQSLQKMTQRQLGVPTDLWVF